VVNATVEIGTWQIEFYAAVTRKDWEGFSNEDWHAEEALSREQALEFFTTAPSFRAFVEDELGTIQVGTIQVADLSVFDRDLMTIPEAEIPSSRDRYDLGPRRDCLLSRWGNFRRIKMIEHLSLVIAAKSDAEQTLELSRSYLWIFENSNDIGSPLCCLYRVRRKGVRRLRVT